MADLLVRQERSITEEEIAHCERSIPAVFDEIERRNSDALALGGDEPTTYGDLARAADRVAGGILDRLGPGAEPVGLLFGSTRSFLEALLGVLKAGKIAMPLDPRAPLAALTATLADSGAKLVLGDVPAVGNRPVIGLDTFDALDCAADDGEVDGDSPALLLYTSGSSGGAKGIVTRHGSEVHRALMCRGQFGGGADVRVGLVVSPAWAAAYGSIFTALLSGATLVRYATDQRGVTDLPAWITSEGVVATVVSSGLLRPLAAASGGGRIRPLQTLLIGGEMLTPGDAELARTIVGPGGRVVHLYGSTESMVSCWHFLDVTPGSDGKLVPAGLSLPGKSVRISDVDDGVGEIVVTSRYMSHGYWGRDAETAAVFSREPGSEERSYRTGDLGRIDPDGRLVIAGRRDRLVKIRGHRVELDALERAVSAEPEVAEAAVIARQRSSGVHTLVCYIVASSGAIDPQAFKRDLGRVLPSHMIPGQIVTLDVLPRLPNGKVNAQALATMKSTTHTPPRTALETGLVEIWQEILDAPIGIDDDFFDFGADSLAIAEMLAAVQETFGEKVRLPDLESAPTLELLANLLESRGEQYSNVATDRP